MKMTIGMPVLGLHDMTARAINNNTEKVKDLKDFKLVVIDNGSKKSYELNNMPPYLDIIRNEENTGYYYPLLQLYEKYDSGLLGLIHNDLVFIENGWDVKVKKAFEENPKLGVIGLFGSQAIDKYGFWKKSISGFDDKEANSYLYMGFRRVHRLTPAVSLDSLCMIFRRECVPLLNIHPDIGLCHFYDKIWCLRLIENDWRVAVLNVKSIHVGGPTSRSDEYIESIGKWQKKRHLNPIKTDLFMQNYGYGAWISEYKMQKKMIPISINEKYEIKTQK